MNANLGTRSGGGGGGGGVNNNPILSPRANLDFPNAHRLEQGPPKSFWRDVRCNDRHPYKAKGFKESKEWPN